MDKKQEELVVDGYRYGTVADAETARMEEKKVANLEQHLDYNRPQDVLAVYNRALENRVFMTPVGMGYLHRMQQQMVRRGVPQEKIRPIPLYATFSNKTVNNSSIRNSLAARGQKPEFRGRFITSLSINILLALALGAVIVLSLRSDVPTILNYRTTVVNEYSAWEQELTEREQAVRRAERELDVN